MLGHTSVGLKEAKRHEPKLDEAQSA
jgi:hypothetical protein